MPMVEGKVITFGSSDTLALTLRESIKREWNVEKGDKVLLDVEYIEGTAQLVGIKESDK